MLTRVRLPDGDYAWSDDGGFDPERIEWAHAEAVAPDPSYAYVLGTCAMPSGERATLRAGYCTQVDAPSIPAADRARDAVVLAFRTYYAAHRYARGYRPTDAEVKAHCHAVTGTRPA